MSPSTSSIDSPSSPSGPLSRPAPVVTAGGYDADFWWAYAANAALVTANSIMYRYVEFVRLHEPEGPEWYLGWIVGIGMVGSVAMRLFQGSAIDNYGPRRVWLWSAVLFIVSVLGHLFVSEVDAWPVFALRVLLSCALAGVFGSSMVYISRRASPERMAEMIGTLGTSGFIGMMIGTAVGDQLFRTRHVEAWQVQGMFLLAAAMGLLSLGFAALATRHALNPVHHRRKPPLIWLLRRYNPGSILPVGVVMGVGLGIPMVFLADFAKYLHIAGIAGFFTAYTLSAFATRLSIRRFPERYGIKVMNLTGLGLLVAGYVSFLVVDQAWELIGSAIVLGMAHAVLFPAVVAGGSGVFPERHRGVGTSLMLLTMDIGTLLGGPLVGGMLRATKLAGWPTYPTTFLALAIGFAIIGAYYLAVPARVTGSRVRNSPRRRPQPLEAMHPVALKPCPGAAGGEASP